MLVGGESPRTERSRRPLDAVTLIYSDIPGGHFSKKSSQKPPRPPKKDKKTIELEKQVKDTYDMKSMIFP